MRFLVIRCPLYRPRERNQRLLKQRARGNWTSARRAVQEPATQGDFRPFRDEPSARGAEWNELPWAR